MTSRERFEAFISAPPFEKHTTKCGSESAWPNQYRDYHTQFAWECWQAAEAETARRCVELACPERQSDNSDSYDWQDGYNAAMLEARESIRAEYPEAFK